MYTGSLKSALSVNISNIPGWRTNRKIVVIESDDWGSIRMSSKAAFQELLQKGIPVNKSHYNLFDSLECNTDIELLMHSLLKFKDSSGRNPVITTVNIVANPDFKEIANSNYAAFFYESFSQTLKKYPEHNHVLSLWKNGIEKRVLVPVFHGREHLNAQRWMRALQQNHQSTLAAFKLHVTGIPKIGINGEKVPEYQAAFDIDTPEDLIYLKEVLHTGLELFEKEFGFRSNYFVPTNGPFNNSLELDLLNSGVRYINSAKKQREPLGNQKFNTNIRYLGMMNSLGQRYITRNAFFEPASSGFEYPTYTDWVNNCLREVEIAFRWHKPAIISSHRVNYIGFLHPENREKGLKNLESLIGGIIKKWPEVEFLTSPELGHLIDSTH